MSAAATTALATFPPRCEMDDCCSHKGQELAALALQADQRRVLIVVLVINAVMFLAEFSAGFVARSSALQADAVDMLGDAVVYGLSLFAIGRGTRWEAGAAVAKGVLILVFFVVIVGDIALKIAHGVPPSTRLMLIFGSLALAANLTCLALLWRFRKLNVNMSSTFECSRNDVAANAGVLVAAGAVAWLGAGWPDIAVGLLIALVFLRSAVRVLRNAWPQFRG
ncbi:cation transporter [Tahibacter sp.]|uniref:cation transporter n=1 Tax=Tahibacter sp. TaxID=2056211 RepID=UPI0028C37F25|nr:cation transporter [Tahibacter sp.]